MSHYPPRETTIDVLLEVAHKVALESNFDHPEDIGAAMIVAIESAAIAVRVMHECAL